MPLVKTECGHEFDSPYTVEEMLGATMDCPTCGKLLIMKVEAVKGIDFHKFMNETTGYWPADGVGTGYVEFHAKSIL